MRSLILLAPDLALIPPAFPSAEANPIAHRSLLDQLQRLRGKLYLEDGAIEPWQLTVDGRHHLSADDLSWHLLTVDDGLVTGGARLHFHLPEAGFPDLGVARSAQAHCPSWGLALRSSVTLDLQRAQKEGLGFVEAGGWALAPVLRCTTEAMNIALGSYAIADIIGGALGLCTATVRHHSSSILRRMGAGSFIWEGSEIPAYYDPAYGCEMEVLRFDSRALNPRFQASISRLRTKLQSTLVICSQNKAETGYKSLRALSQALQHHHQEHATHTGQQVEALLMLNTDSPL